jgi:hypothetical protein
MSPPAWLTFRNRPRRKTLFQEGVADKRRVNEVDSSGVGRLPDRNLEEGGTADIPALAQWFSAENLKGK